MKVKKIFLFVFCAMFLCLFSCGENKNNVNENSNSSSDSAGSTENSTEAVYHKISAKEAKEMMDSTENYILLDVRTESEYKDKRIDGAVLIPDYEIKDRAESELPDKNAVIFVYCRSGSRSRGASNALVDMGYTNVYDIGGIIDWPYDTVSG